MHPTNLLVAKPPRTPIPPHTQEQVEMRTRAASTHLSSPNLSCLGVGGGRGGHTAQSQARRVNAPARNASTNASRDRVDRLVPNSFQKQRQDSSGGLAVQGKEKVRQMAKPISHHLDFRQHSLEVNTGLRLELGLSQHHLPYTPNPTPCHPVSGSSAQQLPLLSLSEKQQEEVLELGPFCACGYRIALCNAPPLLPHNALTTPNGGSVAAVGWCGGGGNASGEPSPAGSAVTCPGGGLAASTGSNPSCTNAGGQPLGCPLCYARAILDEQRRVALASFNSGVRAPPGGSACTCPRSPKKHVGLIVEPEAITPTRVSEDWKSTPSDLDDEPREREPMGIARLARESLAVAKASALSAPTAAAVGVVVEVASGGRLPLGVRMSHLGLKRSVHLTRTQRKVARAIVLVSAALLGISVALVVVTLVLSQYIDELVKHRINKLAPAVQPPPAPQPYVQPPHLLPSSVVWASTDAYLVATRSPTDADDDPFHTDHTTAYT